MFRSQQSFALALCAAAGVLLSASANAADWSDTSVSWRTGNAYRDPFNTEDISKRAEKVSGTF